MWLDSIEAVRAELHEAAHRGVQDKVFQSPLGRLIDQPTTQKILVEVAASRAKGGRVLAVDAGREPCVCKAAVTRPASLRRHPLAVQAGHSRIIVASPGNFHGRDRPLDLFQVCQREREVQSSKRVAQLLPVSRAQ